MFLCSFDESLRTNILQGKRSYTSESLEVVAFVGVCSPLAESNGSVARTDSGEEGS